MKMQTKLTLSLLDFLSHQGYKYLLSKTVVKDAEENLSIEIMLKPVVNRPDIRSLPEDYDTYFLINREPRVMAKGIDETEFTVCLSEEDSRAFESLNLRVG